MINFFSRKKKHDTHSSLPNATAPKDSNISTAYRVCHFTWTRTILFCKEAFPNASLKSHTIIFTAFSYSITKHIRSQRIVDEIYSQFLVAAKAFIHGDGQDKSLHYIQSTYWQFRTELNASGIDPRNDDGARELWASVLQNAFPQSVVPENIFPGFLSNLRLVTNSALQKYGLFPTKEYYHYDFEAGSLDESANSKKETYYLMEARNGMLVRVPESKLTSWIEAQSKPIPPPTELELQKIQALVDKIYKGSPE